MKLSPFVYLLLSATLLLSQPVWARIKLVALPEREATLVRLDNPQATLLEEERVLTLQAGINHVDFSWKGVYIQPDSIRLTLLEQPQTVNLLSVSYPPNEQALVWEISSPKAQLVRARISYLLDNIDRLVTYQATVQKDESHLNLTAFVVLRNFSGENLPLTRFQLKDGKTLQSSILSGETKRMAFFNVDPVPIKKRFLFNAAELPWDPKLLDHNVGIPVYYEIDNTPANQLGQQALWGGKVRLYSEYGHSSTHNATIFLGEDEATLTPIGQTLALKIGDSQDIVVTQRKIREKRFNERRNYKRNKVVLYDKDETIQVEIENFKAQTAFVTLEEPMPEEWQMYEQSHPYQRESNQKISFDIEVPPKEKVKVTYSYYRRHIRP